MANHFGSGALAVCLTTASLQPFDVVKTYYLTGKDSNTLTEAITYVYKTHGVKGYWRGIQPAIMRGVLSGGLNFLFLEYIRSMLDNKFSSNVLASCVSRTICICSVCPLTVIKTRMEAPQSSQYSSFTHAFKSIFKQEGIRGYYNGLGSNLLRDIPYSGLAFGFYQSYFSFMKLFYDNNSVANVCAAGLGALTATLLTQPFDVLKTRFQYAYVDQAHLHDYQGLLDAFRSIWKTHGVRGFTRGLTIRVIERSVSYGLVWGLYEKLKTKLS